MFVKNYIDQSQEFALCAVALAYPIMTFVQNGRTKLAAVLAAVALGLLANMMFVTVSRTALVTMPVMLAVFAALHMKRRTSIIACCVAVCWRRRPGEPRRNCAESLAFRRRLAALSIQNNPTVVGSRLEYWQKSLRFFAEAPLIGHGTGSTRGLFEQAAIGQIGAHAEIVGNPHNQTLNVAVQWGAIGVALLYAMWFVHLRLFRSDGLMAWIGLMVVVQNIARRCSTRMCSTSTKAGCMCSASASRAV